MYCVRWCSEVTTIRANIFDVCVWCWFQSCKTETYCNMTPDTTQCLSLMNLCACFLNVGVFLRVCVLIGIFLLFLDQLNWMKWKSESLSVARQKASRELISTSFLPWILLDFGGNMCHGHPVIPLLLGIISRYKPLLTGGFMGSWPSLPLSTVKKEVVFTTDHLETDIMMSGRNSFNMFQSLQPKHASFWGDSQA